ncbi:helicase-related protein [Candidatus Viridilinea mediisalina]|uniref:Helicase n=1 Tax=Candidatus Viridilinea mediisalina TaxID=2024553 RepID=A0A2A6RNE3_9CHLR|nr:helicase-related protein [Candidatus Viridilinea mediisalina]PDW04557.1 helicase [Candidatus Viridilinea mediisalina]
MPTFTVGSLVRCREREWVVLPSLDADLLLLRPLGGAEAEICGIFLPVEGERVAEASFAPPDPASMGDFEAGALLRNAARLSLRSGAGPFRSLGRLGVRPRPYQLVPLIMALRLDPVRLLIADDVGIGKTVEAGLIARELFDRGEIARLTVLCPPHLCDQWQRELSQKFALEAVIVRSSTAAALERSLPRGDTSVWEHFPVTVASIDYVKSDRRRDSFLRAAPELVIVDEAHAAVGMGGSAAQQQRYELVRKLAAQANRNLILVTATPHSGVEDAFTSLIGLLDPRFAQFDLAHMADADRDALARHFVQRRRGDVQRWIGADDVTPFPVREAAELTYTMPRSSAYRKLFDEVFAFTRELVQDGMHHEGTKATKDSDSSHLRASVVKQPWRQRARYWAALALLRCVMSSPAAAEKALRLRAAALTTDAQRHKAGAEEVDVEIDAAPLRDAVQDEREQALDFEPALGGMDEEGLDPAVSLSLRGDPTSERGRLNRFAARAVALRGKDDPKLQRLIQVLNDLLRDGYNPIIYCRYIATADYLAAELAQSLSRQVGLRILAVTGERSEEEREVLISELEASPRRVLVATDCLSEGINLQNGFDAVIHYDLPWNPNRLEQREGRVDRYGQRRPTVRTVLLYGQDNPMDEAVMKVLLRKAVRIHKTLGITVPLPVESGTVVESLIASLFQPTAEQMALFDTARQMTLLDAVQAVQAVDVAWDRAVEREQASRTRFAQRRIKPEEVARELEESDAVLGDAAAVERFVMAACERLGVEVKRQKAKGKTEDAAASYEIVMAQLPLPVRERLEASLSASIPERMRPVRATPFSFDLFPFSFDEVGRNHPLVVALADYLMETALAPDEDVPVAARSGVVRTRAVTKRTRLLLLRARMLIESVRQRTPVLAEELVVVGFSGQPAAPAWLSQPDALALLEQTQPAANLTRDERSMALNAARAELPALADELGNIAEARAAKLREAHLRVRTQTGGGSVRVRPAGPPDVLGLYMLLPTLSG